MGKWAGVNRRHLVNGVGHWGTDSDVRESRFTQNQYHGAGWALQTLGPLNLTHSSVTAGTMSVESSPPPQKQASPPWAPSTQQNLGAPGSL